MPLLSRQLNPNRSFSLDVFRGLTIAGMILVNTPGGPSSYAPLEHAVWNGWTVTDLVFPSFAFIVGIALTYVLASNRSTSSWPGLSLFDWIMPVLLAIKSAIMLLAPQPPAIGYDIFLAALLVLLVALPQLERRAAASGGSSMFKLIHHGFLIFALGFVWTFDVAHPDGFRVMGVLQRLGIVYLFTGLIVLTNGRRGQIAWAVGLLAIYWLVMKIVPVPGWGAGVLTVEGNLAGYLDRLILGSAHLYVPQPGFDPEGILGSIPAIATGLLGALAGGWLREETPLTDRISGLFVAGSLLLFAGLALNPFFPVNKNLWSPTYVLLAGGIDCIALGICVWFVDFKGARAAFYPLIALGSNSIVLYLVSGTMRHYAGEIPGGTVNGVAVSAWDAAYHAIFAPLLSPNDASLAMGLAYVMVWTGIAIMLYRAKIFIKI